MLKTAKMNNHLFILCRRSFLLFIGDDRPVMAKAEFQRFKREVGEAVIHLFLPYGKLVVAFYAIFKSGI